MTPSKNNNKPKKVEYDYRKKELLNFYFLTSLPYFCSIPIPKLQLSLLHKHAVTVALLFYILLTRRLEDSLVAGSTEKFLVQRNSKIFGVLPQHLPNGHLVVLIVHDTRQQLIGRGRRWFSSSSNNQTKQKLTFDSKNLRQCKFFLFNRSLDISNGTSKKMLQ